MWRAVSGRDLELLRIDSSERSGFFYSSIAVSPCRASEAQQGLMLRTRPASGNSPSVATHRSSRCLRPRCAASTLHDWPPAVDGRCMTRTAGFEQPCVPVNRRRLAQDDEQASSVDLRVTAFR